LLHIKQPSISLHHWAGVAPQVNDTRKPPQEPSARQHTASNRANASLRHSQTNQHIDNNRNAKIKIINKNK
jgi:hypothetical protein